MKVIVLVFRLVLKARSKRSRLYALHFEARLGHLLFDWKPPPSAMALERPVVKLCNISSTRRTSLLIQLHFGITSSLHKLE